MRASRWAASAPGRGACREVEAALRGKHADDATLQHAAARPAQGAQAGQQNGFKLMLLQRTVLRALQTVSA